MALTRSPGGEPDNDNPAIWSADTTLRKDEYFKQYLDGKTSPGDEKLEPQLRTLLTKLYDRQRTEAYDLLDEATSRIHPDGEDRASLKTHRQAFRGDYQKLCSGFAAERERYITDFQRAQRLKAEMEQTRRETLERGIDPDKPKLSR